MILPYRGAPRRVKNVEHITCPGCGWLFPPGAAEQGRCLSCGLTSLWHAPELQSERGKASGVARRKATADRDAEIRRLHGQGEPKKQIARTVGVSAKMVRNVLDRRGGPNHAHARAQAREAWGGTEPRARVRIRIRGAKARDAEPSRIERSRGESVPFPPLRLTGNIAARG